MPPTYSLEDVVASLRNVLFLKSLDDSQLATLAKHIRICDYPTGARLILEGTYGDTLFIIYEGEAEVYIRRRGEKVVLARRGSGAIVGDMALVESGLRAATVQTTRRSTILELKKPAFDALLAEHPAISSFVLKEVTRRLRHTDTRMVEELATINADLLAAQRHIEHTYDVTLAALSSALDLRDTETEGHSRRVTEYTLALGRAMGLDESQLRILQRGALLHDIGKIGVPDAILRKPGMLDREERALMQNHPTWGAEILRGIAFLRDAIPVVRSHHEWWDGRGYPDGLHGEEIPLFARIFAIADTFDALTSNRPYRSALTPREALQVMRSEAGTHLDPALFALFESLFYTVIEPLCRQYQRQPLFATAHPYPATALADSTL